MDFSLILHIRPLPRLAFLLGLEQQCTHFLCRVRQVTRPRVLVVVSLQTPRAVSDDLFLGLYRH